MPFVAVRAEILPLLFAVAVDVRVIAPKASGVALAVRWIVVGVEDPGHVTSVIASKSQTSGLAISDTPDAVFVEDSRPNPEQ